MSDVVTPIEEQVTATEAYGPSVVVLVRGIAARIAANASDPVVMVSLAAELNNHAVALAQAVVAGGPIEATPAFVWPQGVPATLPAVATPLASAAPPAILPAIEPAAILPVAAPPTAMPMGEPIIRRTDATFTRSTPVPPRTPADFAEEAALQEYDPTLHTEPVVVTSAPPIKAPSIKSKSSPPPAMPSSKPTLKPPHGHNGKRATHAHR
jgi:hypothetical protein